MQSARDWPNVFVAMVTIFLSILVHELGHALAARHFGQRPSIYFHGLGGLTVFQGASLGRWQHFATVAAGPVASLLLAGIFICLIPLESLSPLMRPFILIGLWVNIVWTVLNCLPVLPLDGGQMLRDLLGAGRERLACTIGAVTAVVMGLAGLAFGFILLAVLMGFLAYSNYKGTTSLQGGVMRQ